MSSSDVNFSDLPGKTSASKTTLVLSLSITVSEKQQQLTNFSWSSLQSGEASTEETVQTLVLQPHCPGGGTLPADQSLHLPLSLLAVGLQMGGSAGCSRLIFFCV